MKLSIVGLKANWKKSLLNPQATQQLRLEHILSNNAETIYGKEYSFSSIKNINNFRKAVPVVSYNDIKPYIEKMKEGENSVLTKDNPEMFAITSGTTGSPKFLPMPRAMNLEQHISHRIWMGHLAQSHTGVVSGKLFTSFSAAVEGYTNSGIPYGSASGKNYRNQPIPVRRLHAVPYEIVNIKDYDARYYCMLLFLLASDLSCATSVNPSTLFLLGERMENLGEKVLDDFKRLIKNPETMPENISNLLREEWEQISGSLRITNKRLNLLEEIFKTDGKLLPANIWDKLAVICTWHGGNAPFYLSKLPEKWGDVPTRCLGLRASEGMFSIPVADRTPEGILATWGHFMEFVPEGEEPTRHGQTLLAHELQQGNRYRMIITTSGGLYRYDLGDIIEVTGFQNKTPQVAFKNKAGKTLSITGEKVTEYQVVQAANRALTRHNISGFSVTLRFSDCPVYVLAVEPETENTKLPEKEIAEKFDAELMKENVEYEAKRNSGRLAIAEFIRLSPGTYNTYRKKLVEAGRPEGQIKPPHLLKSEDELKQLFSL
jgi:hypothetical protein